MLSCPVLAAPHPRPRTSSPPMRNLSASYAAALASHSGFVPCSGQTLGLSTCKRLPACSFSAPLQDEIAPFFSCIYKMLHQQLLSFDIHAFSWGVYGGCILAPFSNLYPPTFNRCLFTLLRTLLHFFALAQNSTLFFSSNSALFHKNTRGWGTPTVLTRLLPCLLASMPLASAHPARSKGH